MTKISIAFLAALSLAGFGCRKDKAKDKVNPGEAIAKLTGIKNKMCACPDKACSEKISEELTAWDQEQEKAAGDKPVSLSGEDAEKVEALKEEISQCLLKIELPGGSGAPGAAGGAGGTAGSGSPAGSAGGSAAAGVAPAAGSADGAAAAGSAH